MLNIRETPFTGYAFSNTFCPQTGISSRYLKYHFFLRAEYRDPKLAQLHHDYLAGGPLEYMAAIFRKLADSDETAMQLALEF